MRKFQSIGELKRSPWDSYLEQRANKKQVVEVKLSYVAGKVFTDHDSVYLSPKSLRTLHRIQEYLGLEVFSVNAFVAKTGAFYIVDVNPAPAFFYNPKARHAFTSYIGVIGKLHPQ